METKQIIDGLLDRAERSADLSAGRIMRRAAERLQELEKLLELARAERNVVTKRMIEMETERGMAHES